MSKTFADVYLIFFIQSLLYRTRNCSMSFFYLEKNVSAKHAFVNRKFNMGDNNKVYDLQHR